MARSGRVGRATFGARPEGGERFKGQDGQEDVANLNTLW